MGHSLEYGYWRCFICICEVLRILKSRISCAQRNNEQTTSKVPCRKSGRDAPPEQYHGRILNWIVSPGVQKSYSTSYTARPYSDYDGPRICSWVPTAEKLRLISGDVARRLSLDILHRWLAEARISLVVCTESDSEPVGFCTLTRSEVADLPPSHIELCHLTVSPRCRYLIVGSQLIIAAQALAQRSGYRFLCGRVVPTNRYGLTLVSNAKAEEMTGNAIWALTGFRWFQLPVTKRVFKRKVDWEVDR